MSLIRNYFRTLQRPHHVAQWVERLTPRRLGLVKEARVSVQDLLRCHLHDTIRFTSCLVAIPWARRAEAAH